MKEDPSDSSTDEIIDSGLNYTFACENDAVDDDTQKQVPLFSLRIHNEALGTLVKKGDGMEEAGNTSSENHSNAFESDEYHEFFTLITSDDHTDGVQESYMTIERNGQNVYTSKQIYYNTIRDLMRILNRDNAYNIPKAFVVDSEPGAVDALQNELFVALNSGNSETLQEVVRGWEKFTHGRQETNIRVLCTLLKRLVRPNPHVHFKITRRINSMDRFIKRPTFISQTYLINKKLSKSILPVTEIKRGASQVRIPIETIALSKLYKEMDNVDFKYLISLIVFFRKFSNNSKTTFVSFNDVLTLLARSLLELSEDFMRIASTTPAYTARIYKLFVVIMKSISALPPRILKEEYFKPRLA